jgi:hypothetical protein
MRTDPTTEATTKPHEIITTIKDVEIWYTCAPEGKVTTRNQEVKIFAIQCEHEGSKLMQVEVVMGDESDSETWIQNDQVKPQLLLWIADVIYPYYTDYQHIEVQFKK